MNFLDGYYKTGQKIKSKAARAEFYMATLEYYHEEIEPTFKSEVAEVAFEAIRFSLDKAIAGRKGGQKTQEKKAKVLPIANKQNEESASGSKPKVLGVAESKKSESTTPTKEEEEEEGTNVPLEEEEEREPACAAQSSPAKASETFDAFDAKSEERAQNLKLVIDEFNNATGQDIAYPSTKDQMNIQKIFDSGRTIHDVIDVIHCKNAEWSNDPKMAKYVRPSTLFGEKFEEYLAQARAEENKRGETDAIIEDIACRF